MKNKFLRLSEKSFVYSAIIAFCILFILVLPLGHDLHFHVYRIGAMAEELRRTSFALPVRILSVSYDNYGYGVPLFYSDLLLYLPAFLSVLGMDPVTAFKIFMVLMFLLTFAAMYKMILRGSNSENFAFTASIFYGFSCYCLIDLCIRMAVGEAGAGIFLPVVFCSFYNMLYNPLKNDWLFLASGMTGLILSHHLTAVFTAAILAIWALFEFRRIFANKCLVKIALAGLATAGLTASFVFGFLEAVIVQKYQIPTNSGYQIQEFSKHTFEFIDFFLSYDVKKGLKTLFNLNWDTETWRPGGFGLFLAAVVIIALKSRKKPKNKVLSAAFWLSVLLYACMFIRPLITYISHYLSFMQFFWRTLIFASFAISVYAAYVLDKFFSPKWQKAYIAAAVLAAVYTVAPRYAYQIFLDYKGFEYIQMANPEFAGHYIMEYSPNNGDALYLPEGVSRSLYEKRGNVAICSRDGVSYEFVRENGKCHIKVSDNPYSDTSFELPLYYYKGYVCIDQNTGDPVEVAPSSSKLVEVRLNGIRQADLIVWYRGTTIQKLGDIISALTLAALALFYVFPFVNASKTSK